MGQFMNLFFAIGINPGFYKKISAHKYFHFWKKNKYLEKVLIRLVGLTPNLSESDYQRLLSHLRKAPALETMPRLILNLKLELQIMEIKEQGNRRMNEEEWELFMPLILEKIGESRERPLPILNSIFSVLIGKVESWKLPIDPNFARRSATLKFFTLWKKDGTLKKVLNRLEKGAQGSAKIEYQKALKKLPNTHLLWKSKV